MLNNGFKLADAANPDLLLVGIGCESHVYHPWLWPIRVICIPWFWRRGGSMTPVNRIIRGREAHEIV